ncbi:MAG: hypothetical protein ACP5U0_08825 [Caldisphaera sp.]
MKRKMLKYAKFTRDINSDFLGGVIAILLAVIFALILGWYNYLMVQSYNYTNFDLGISYRAMYLFAYKHIIVWNGKDIFFEPIPYTKLIFVPLSFTLYIYNSAFTPLMDQIIIIAIGGYSVFGITKMKTRNVFASLSLEIVYFLYPATYGFMAHGGNLMVFLEGFLLLGYLLYLKKMYKYSFIAFAFASISNAFGPVIVITLLLIDYLSNATLNNPKEKIRNFRLNKLHNLTKNRDLILYFYVALILFDAVIFTDTLIKIGGINGLFSNSRIPVSDSLAKMGTGNKINYFNLFQDGLGNWKIPFLNEIFSPFLFIPIMTLYIIPVAAYILFVLITNPSNATVYYIPTQQYPFLFASFLFMGTIHFFRDKFSNPEKAKIAKKILVLVMISSLISFAVYSPFCIENFQNGTIMNEMTVTPFDMELSNGLSLIPPNATVFIQNSLPQLADRQNVYMPGYYNNQTVDYAVIIPFGFSTISDEYGGYSPYWANSFQNNSSYGIYESISGAIIYKLQYYSSPVYYVPFYQKIVPGESGLNGYGYIYNDTLYLSNIKNFYHNTLWGGGYTTLSPGIYKFSFQVETSNNNPNNSFYQYVWAGSGEYNLGDIQITGKNFSYPGQWINYSITLKIDNFYTEVEFPAFYNQWNGSIEFRGVTIQEIAPPIKAFQKINNFKSPEMMIEKIPRKLISTDLQRFQQLFILFFHSKVVGPLDT